MRFYRLLWAKKLEVDNMRISLILPFEKRLILSPSDITLSAKLRQHSSIGESIPDFFLRGEEINALISANACWGSNFHEKISSKLLKLFENCLGNGTRCQCNFASSFVILLHAPLFLRGILLLTESKLRIEMMDMELWQKERGRK